MEFVQCLFYATWLDGNQRIATMVAKRGNFDRQYEWITESLNHTFMYKTSNPMNNDVGPIDAIRLSSEMYPLDVHGDNWQNNKTETHACMAIACFELVHAFPLLNNNRNASCSQKREKKNITRRIESLYFLLFATSRLICFFFVHLHQFDYVESCVVVGSVSSGRGITWGSLNKFEFRLCCLRMVMALPCPLLFSINGSHNSQKLS